MIKTCYAFFAIVLGLAAPSLAATELLKTETSWDGGEIHYPTGQPEVTSVKLAIAAGEETVFHCHPIPTLGYILKGDVEVETKSGKTTVLKQGESVVEVMRTLHRGKAVAGPVEIVVFYAGSTTMPTTVLADSADSAKYCTP